MKRKDWMMSDMVTTSFQMDYSLLMALQARARELGFRSWGHYLRHVVDYHVMLVEPDLMGVGVGQSTGH